MSWMKTLYQTYENNAALAGKSSDNFAALSLVAHIVANAQLEITVDGQGNLVSAIEVDKNDKQTIIPATEKSANRSSGIAPHPLCDTLSYIAGDFSDYLSSDKDKKTAADKFTAYSEALQKWSESEFSHPKVKAIYAYISKSQIMSDLIKSEIVEIDENGVLCNKKIQGNAYDKVIVRFRVAADTLDGFSNATWEDSSLFNSFINYYSSIQSGQKDICYIKGVPDITCVNHPKGIIAATYGAKLVSSNDSSNFTYRGRFENSEQAYSISYEATQKAHNALTWLAKNQGISIGNQDKRTYICWNPNGKSVPSIDDDPCYCGEEQETDRPLTEPEYADRLKKAFEGYADRFDYNDNIVIIALDAATTGRLSVTYYNELKASDFLKRFKEWSETCHWYFPAFTQDKKLYYEVRTPLAKRTVAYAFGSQQGNFVEVSDKILKEQYQRIVHCMFDEAPVPRDIVHALAIKASNPMAYSFVNYENILSTACAYIAKYYLSKGVNFKMTLDMENNDRSYLFGRLLAIAEKIERSTYNSDENREPNAIRLQSAFVHHPMHTWYSLNIALNPYFQRLSPGSREFYRDLITGIVTQIQSGDVNILNASLDDSYLIGYFLQRAELKKNKNNTNNTQEDK